MPPKPAREERAVLNLFRLWSRAYDWPVFQKVYYGRIHEKMLRRAGGLSPRRILEVGCGTGELLLACSRKWPQAELSGLDLSAHMLEKARAKDYGRKARLVEGNVYAPPFEDGSFDLVVNSISSHFYEDGPRAFGEMGRVTAPGGRLLQASLDNGFFRFLPGPWKEAVHVPSAVYRSPQAQQKLLEGAGFRVEHSGRVAANAYLYECVKRSGATS